MKIDLLAVHNNLAWHTVLIYIVNCVLHNWVGKSDSLQINVCKFSLTIERLFIRDSFVASLVCIETCACDDIYTCMFIRWVLLTIEFLYLIFIFAVTIMINTDAAYVLKYLYLLTKKTCIFSNVKFNISVFLVTSCNWTML